jgi:hypothetical protein
VIFPDEGNKDYDEPMIYEQGELEPLFIGDQPAEKASQENERKSEADDESESSAGQGNDNSPDRPGQGDPPKSTQNSSPGDDQYECQNCGEMATVSIAGASGHLACDACGFTPDEDDERFDHLRCQGDETTEPDQSSDGKISSDDSDPSVGF